MLRRKRRSKYDIKYKYTNGPLWYQSFANGNADSSMIPVPHDWFDAKFLFILFIISLMFGI